MRVVPEETEVARLDYSKPPPGYRIDESEDDEWDWSVGDNPTDGNANLITTESDAIIATWAHFKTRNDPPGLFVASYGDAVFWVHLAGLPIVGPFQAEACRDKTEASLSPGVDRARVACRAAAWAWYDRRHALAVRPSPRRWYSKAPPDDDAGSACTITIHRSPEAAKKAVLAVLEDGSEGWPEDVEAVEWGELVPMSKAQEFDREATPEGEFDYVCKYRLAVCTWPRCLTWSDEQVVEVERWLRNSTVEMPEVLRG